MNKLAALIVTVTGLAVPFVHHSGTLTRAGVERALLQRENGGANGHVTSSVHCVTRGGNRYVCRLRSVRHTSLTVAIEVHGRSLQGVWAPLEG